MNKFTMELVWHSCNDYLPKEDYNACLYVTDGRTVFPMRWKRDPNWQRFENGGWYIEPNINANGYWWADISQTVQGEPRFKGFIVDDITAIVDDITAEEIEQYMKSATKKMIVDYVKGCEI